MVQRQENFADWIADEEGNLRPGAMDMLNRANRNRIWINRWNRVRAGFNLVRTWSNRIWAVTLPVLGWIFETLPRLITLHRVQICFWASLVVINILFARILITEFGMGFNGTSTHQEISKLNQQAPLNSNHPATTIPLLVQHQSEKVQAENKSSDDTAKTIKGYISSFFTKQANHNHSGIKNKERNFDSPVPGSKTLAQKNAAPSKEMNKRKERTGRIQNNRLLGMAKVFGYDVNIRESPRTDSIVVRQVSQGEIFQVISYSDGWYEIKAEKIESGFIFGAYLLPIDFNHPFLWNGLSKDNKKLLLTKAHRPSTFKILTPDGTNKFIDKSHVKIIN